ncbi:MAG: class II aldolase/adducin family protein [Candidatus Eisenbacteria bacterium]|nr:class II aldolase/adducin family protein [Candidatus Eisenbacteria bacterium]
MTTEFEARRQIVEVGRRLWLKGYVAANDGNLSVRLRDGRIVITPTGVSKGFLEPDALIVVDAEGRKLRGRLEPTSEIRMHLFAYDRRPDVSAVVHAHPPKATGFSAAGVPLAQCILPEVVLSLGDVPTAPYATPSTEEVARSIELFIGGYNAMILRRHGVLTLGAGIFEAYWRMETVEHVADITLVAKLMGGAPPLSNEEVRKLLKLREKLGTTTSAPCASCGGCGTTAAAPAKSTDGGIVDEVVRRVTESLGRP